MNHLRHIPNFAILNLVLYSLNINSKKFFLLVNIEHLLNSFTLKKLHTLIYGFSKLHEVSTISTIVFHLTVTSKAKLYALAFLGLFYSLKQPDSILIHLLSQEELVKQSFQLLETNLSQPSSPQTMVRVYYFYDD